MIKWMMYELYGPEHPISALSVLAAVVVLGLTYGAIKFARFLCRRFLLPRLGWTPERGMGVAVLRIIAVFVGLGGVFLALRFLGYSSTNIWLILNRRIYSIGGGEVNLFSLAVCLAVASLTVWAFKHAPGAMERQLFSRFRLESGVEYTFQRITQYAVVIVGGLIALKYLGVKFEGLAVFAGLMSVGFGFGLQNIVSNFVSGIILLFERPVQVGDRIRVGDTVGDIQAIRIRSTVVLTPDNIIFIVPNSDLLTTTVTNWSSIDRKVRLHIPVGVAYGSDVDKVKRCLLEVAHEHSEVLDDPAPRVWFVGFGNSSLDFELLAWIPDPAIQYEASSDLHFAIDRIFRVNEVTIPFPQRDVHIYRSPEVKFDPAGLRVTRAESEGDGTPPAE